MTQPELFSVVSAAEATRTPYPFVYVNEDGTVRELHEAERKYLEKPFSPWDGGRPYVKSAFDSRGGPGTSEGYCRRSDVPAHVPIAPAPAEDPTRPMSKTEFIAWMKERDPHLEVTETPDGTHIQFTGSLGGAGEPKRAGNPKRSWWRRLFGGTA